MSPENVFFGNYNFSSFFSSNFVFVFSQDADVPACFTLHFFVFLVLIARYFIIVSLRFFDFRLVFFF